MSSSSGGLWVPLTLDMSDNQRAEKAVGCAPLYSSHGFRQQVEVWHWGGGVVGSKGWRGELNA